MFCLVNSITQSWMLEHWEGGPGSWCCREGLGFIFRQVQAKAKLPSTAFTLNTSCSSYSGSGRRQASLKRHVDLARGGRLFFPCRFLTQVQINLHVCHVNWSRPSRKESAEMYILLSRKLKKKKKKAHAGVCARIKTEREHFLCTLTALNESRRRLKNTWQRGSRGSVLKCDKSRRNTCSNQLSITTAVTPSAASFSLWMMEAQREINTTYWVPS